MGLYGLIIALAPPTIYDALWYHLQAPRLFLAAGRIYPEPHNWPANLAFAGSMLYAIPLALGNDTAPALLLAHAYRIARRHAPATAWAAPALLLTAPVGDARHYYCPAVCDPEADHFTWPRLVWAAGLQVDALRERLRQRGVTYLWVSRPDLEWLRKQDPGGWVGRSVRFL